MIAFILSAITGYTGAEVLIYISIALEALLSIIGILCYIFPASTKFGAFLRKLFRGAKKVQDEVEEIIENNAEEQEDERRDKND